MSRLSPIAEHFLRAARARAPRRSKAMQAAIALNDMDPGLAASYLHRAYEHARSASGRATLAAADWKRLLHRTGHTP